MDGKTFSPVFSAKISQKLGNTNLSYIIFLSVPKKYNLGFEGKNIVVVTFFVFLLSKTKMSKVSIRNQHDEIIVGILEQKDAIDMYRAKPRLIVIAHGVLGLLN
jgi:hypothetical protein